MPKVTIGTADGADFKYELNTLTKHAAVLGTTGSGKTVMCKVLIEEALAKGIPVIAIDPKGDIGGLGIANSNFDFRPFISGATAKKTAEEYYGHHSDTKLAEQLSEINTTIYTPKSNAGRQLSLMPNLDAPDNFDASDPLLLANLVEPLAESICGLAGISGSAKDKAQSFMTEIIQQKWAVGEDLTIQTLIDTIIEPTFDSIGSLPLDSFMKPAERNKLAASVNLLLTSPSKRVWAQGDPLDIASMFKPGTLSVIDLRYAGSQDEKQFVAEQVMQEVYKFLLKKGGSEKLNYLLYFDELAGFLPPPPSNPPCKKLLELLIRQARAFGLGIIVATQNPGDIDYKVFGNIGTRFIGKLRTQNDVEKVAVAADIAPNDLKELLNPLETGQFIYNNAVDNETKQIHARWLYTYHGGPLKDQEIQVVNGDIDKKDFGTLDVDSGAIAKKRKNHASKKEKPSNIFDEEDIENLLPDSEKKTVTIRKEALAVLKERVGRYSDRVEIKMAVSNAKTFVPNLKLVIEPKNHDGAQFDPIGPFIFDLSEDAVPKMKLEGYDWMEPKDDFKLIPAKRSVRDSVLYAIRQSKLQLARPVFVSTLDGFTADNLDTVAKHNLTRLMKTRTHEPQEAHFSVQRVVLNNKQKIKDYRKKLGREKSKRFWRRVFGNKKISKKTSTMETWERHVRHLKKENKKLGKDIKKHIAQDKHAKENFDANLYKRAQAAVKEKKYKPTTNDVTVHATILLVPKKVRL